MNCIGTTESDAVTAALELFVQAMGVRHWEARRSKAVDYMTNVFTATEDRNLSLTDPASRVSFDEDKMAWYLLLVESYLDASELYDYAQGTRVIPTFLRIGSKLETLDSIEGSEDRVERVARESNDNPDAGLFELLVALAYADSGYESVRFVPESSSKKTPDLAIGVADEEFYVECKRMASSSDFSLQEREKRLRMWEPLKEYLQENECPLLLTVVFHVDLATLDDNVLRDELIPLLRFAVPPGTVASNDTWTVSVEEIDLSTLEEELRTTDIKVNSPLLDHLLGNPCDPNWESSWIVKGRRSGCHESYLSDIKFVAGARWRCDAPSVIGRKARDIKRHFAKAIRQIPAGEIGVIHIGLEALDGDLVEGARLKRISDSLTQFDMKDSGVVTGYWHTFRPLLHPRKPWEFEETTRFFSRVDPPFYPLRSELLVVPKDASVELS